MVKLRKDPSKRQQEAPDPVEHDIGGGGDNELEDFDDFLRSIDDDEESDSDGEVNDEDDDEAVAEESDNDGGDDDDENMEPEEEDELNEDGEEGEDEEDSDEQEEGSSDGQEGEEGEEGAPIMQNGGLSHSDNTSEESEQEDGNDKMTAKKHKMDLKKLQGTDPEFFAFLKQNDKELLNFDESDSEEADSDDEGALHKPPETLEEASDSEAEEERLDDTSDEHKSKVQKNLKKGVVDINVISYWHTQLSETREIGVLTNVVDALQCAVTTLSQGETDGLKWRVDGSANFNALIRLCIKEIKGFCIRFLCGNNNVTASANKFDRNPFEVRDRSKQKWQRLRPKMKAYMDIMVKLFKCMGNPDAIASVLRHCLTMSGFWALFATKSFKMMRALTNIWSQSEDSCRVLAFLTIIRMTNCSKDVFLLHMFKQMYIAYVANCKFTSVNTWPAVNFMRSSLVELYLLDTGLAYSVAFPFIRQLAIHLRNALSNNSVQQTEGKQKKSEASRVVYSWQFIHSLHLWVDVLSQAGAMDDENLKLLVYPVVQICMGTVKLIPTKKFIPIRFHIVRMLIKMQEKAGVFIPVLPLITEVLRLTDFSSKSASKFSVRPIDLTCCLKADASETGYLKAVADNVFETILLYCKAVATDLGFPEMVTPTTMFLKTFMKKNCKNVEVNKKFKVLLDKIEANSKYINERRNKALENGSVTLADKKSHRVLQVQMLTSKPNPPISVYATDYFKVNQKAQVKSQRPQMETREERLIPKPSVAKNKAKEKKDPANFDKPMFESDSDEVDDDEEMFSTKLDAQQAAEKKNGKVKIKKRKNVESELSDDADNNGSDEEFQSKPLKKKKKKGKGKNKPPAPVDINDANDVGDQLVDFELSD